ETLRAEAGPTALVLSCEPTLLMRWLIPRIAGFMQEQPRLSIQLVAGGGPFAFGRGIDLAIRGISQRISKVGSQDSTSAVGPASA
ncbi:hypothetical protein ACV34Y_33510, partial [Pseudomonas aeruginosa]